ncbi:hypothetical protein HXA32_01535 [Salipaludibacillus agaradhaerens]|nr:hypothetical protein [Salipaludibacillus agaradhaerens]
MDWIRYIYSNNGQYPYLLPTSFYHHKNHLHTNEDGLVTVNHMDYEAHLKKHTYPTYPSSIRRALALCGIGLYPATLKTTLCR